jgi:Tol biopolymer transport system component
MPVTLMAGLPWDVVAAVSPDKAHIAYVEYQDNRGRIIIVRLGETTPVFERTYPVAADVALTWSPDGRRLACSLLYPASNSNNPGGSGPVWLIDVESRRLHVFWYGRVSNVSWWPDSKRLLFHINENQTDEIWLIDPAQRRQTALNSPPIYRSQRVP